VTPTGIERTFDRTVLGSTGLTVGRLGVASSYGVQAKVVESAFEQGVNYFYWGTLRRGGFGEAIRHLGPQRERFVVVVQSYSRIAKLAGWSIERALRELHLDHADILLLGLWNTAVPERILDAARKMRDRGLVRYLAISSHNRSFLGGLVESRAFDVVHFRYNAKHTGAEADIFPHISSHVAAQNRPGMVSYTATSWKQLMNPEKVPKGERVPTAADCYRFVLSRSEVDVCMTGPANAAHMEEALTALRQGPMPETELAWMRRVGVAIRGQ
jgi:aryl-alcohol dehydrogenase-like predicted oxidoreductase